MKDHHTWLLKSRVQKDCPIKYRSPCWRICCFFRTRRDRKFKLKLAPGSLSRDWDCIYMEKFSSKFVSKWLYFATCLLENCYYFHWKTKMHIEVLFSRSVSCLCVNAPKQRFGWKRKMADSSPSHKTDIVWLFIICLFCLLNKSLLEITITRDCNVHCMET